MALNLGRASTLQDWDIQTERPHFPDEVDGLWGSMFSAWCTYSPFPNGNRLDKGRSYEMSRSFQLPVLDLIKLVRSDRVPVDFAQLQGELYNQLYCAQAQKDSVEVKTERARALAIRMTEIMVRTVHLEATLRKRSDLESIQNRFDYHAYGIDSEKVDGFSLKESLIAIRIVSARLNSSTE
jgi:hypothetical protein